MDATLRDLQHLLSETHAAARTRRRNLWASFWAPGTPLVLHGAGRVGVRTLRQLRSDGIEPEAFADYSPNLQGTVLEGLPVLSPAEASARWGDRGLFLVTVLNRDHSYLATARAYTALGGCRTAPVLAYFWSHPEACLPYYAMSSPESVLEDGEAILAAFATFDDPSSRAHLGAYVRWRLHLDYDALPGPSAGMEYFAPEVVSLQGPQCFVDCGAYDGDTLRQFLGQAGNEFQGAHLLEPDPATFQRLASRVQELPPHVAAKVSLYPIAAGAGPGRLRFQGDGAECSALSPAGNIEVPVAALDEVLAGIIPTFLKMDIEGAELEALRGAAHLIQVHHPSLAICVYHRPDHPWRVPLLMRQFLPRHRLALRPHGADGWEWVAYAIPAT